VRGCAGPGPRESAWGLPRIDRATEAAIRKALTAGMGIGRAAREHGVGTAVAQRIKHEPGAA
jgi:hypothetical protein